MAEYEDIGGDRIERSVGDEWGRVPHFTVVRKGSRVAKRGVLYWPTPNGMWGAKAFGSVDAAAAYLDNKFGATDG